ncbi:hypothetical protein [Thermostaphylospora chromogena]|nr:hypothetical protein [Thermostaphylospora chromogena]
MGASFHGAWVEDPDVGDVATRLGADPASGVGCRWADLRSGLDIDENGCLAWVGRLTENWTQIIFVGNPDFEPLPDLSSGNRRALCFSWTVNGVDDLYYAVDGRCRTVFSVTRPGVRGGPDPHALDSYASGLQFDAQDSSWESDPDLLPGWMEYCAWEERRLEEAPSEGDYAGTGDDYEGMRPEWGHLLELAVNGYNPPIATCITSALILVGRVTGRELDEAWLEGVHTRFRV